jgi:hypothetical protein
VFDAILLNMNSHIYTLSHLFHIEMKSGAHACNRSSTTVKRLFSVSGIYIRIREEI